MPKVKRKPVKLCDRNIANSSAGGTSSSANASEQKQNAARTPKIAIFDMPKGLDEFLDDCNYYLSVKTDNAEVEPQHYNLGSLLLKLADPFNVSLLDKVDELWLYVSAIPGRSFIYTEWVEDNEELKQNVKKAVFSRIDESTDLSFLADDQPGKMIRFVLNPVTDQVQLVIKISLLDSYISTDNPSGMQVKSNKGVQNVMKHFYNVEIPPIKFQREERSSVKHLDLLYSSIKQFHQAQNSPTDVQHKEIKVQLRPYQVNSVNWMLLRERLLHETSSEELHPLYQEIVTHTGEVLFYNKYLGTFVKKRPIVKPPTPGGILADEMGLGKTVEVLACVLANPRPMEELKIVDIVDEDNVQAYKPANAFDSSAETIIKSPRKSKIDAKIDVMFRSESKKSGSACRKRSLSEMEVEEGTDELQVKEEPQGKEDKTVVPRKKVRFSDEISLVPRKGKIRELPEEPEDLHLKSIIKPFEKPENLPVDDKAIRDMVHKARKKAREEAYMKELSAYSAVKHLQNNKKRHSGLFEGEIERKSFFECVCGEVGSTDMYDNAKVKCTECGIIQHKKCVRFNDEKMGAYFCPHCNVRRPLVESKTTLIVAPAAISQQWMDEVKKLVSESSLLIKFYNGVFSDGYYQPQSFAAFDIVITTYEVLSKELDYVDLPHCNAVDGRRFRNAKRYTSLPSPLPCVQWWRVCLDEAQMVECTTTRSAEMALRLNAVNRWCITGTPVQQSLQDLYGLVMFLGVDPFCFDMWWNVLVQGPFITGNPIPLCELICPLMWRTAKVDVLDQINIPPQVEEIHWINFSPIEEHFYRRQHVECGKMVLGRISQQPSLDLRLQSLPKDVLDKILKPLINLRQACCHPQTVKGKFSVANAHSNKTITMQELMKNLIIKAKTECEESLRMIISSLNGLAGLSIIQEKWAEAAQYYREVLTFVDENKDKIKADKLQRIHTLRNLKELLESNHENVIIRESELNLDKDSEQLEDEYLAKFISTVDNAKQSLLPLSAKVTEAEKELVLEEAWWSSVLTLAATLDDEQEIVERIRQTIEGLNKKSPKETKIKMNQFKNLIAIEATLLHNTESLDKEHKKVLKDMKKIQSMDAQSLVNEAVDCHLRTILTDEVKKKKNKCKLCLVSDSFKKYEKVLFREVTSKDSYEHMDLDDVRIFGQLQTIVWAAGDTERVLKTLHTYAKLKNVDEDWIKDGAAQLKLIDAKKKEFKNLRSLWSQINDYISALDELNMCKLRFRLRYENEPLVKNKPRKKKGNPDLGSNMQNKVEHIYIIEEHEVEPQSLRLTLERSEGERSLRRRKGQLQYLLNLEQNDIAIAGGENPEPCPVCRKTLGSQWTVLLCGHCYCVECLEELKRRRINKRILKCPICREDTASGEISYINTKMQPEIDAKKNELDELEDLEAIKKLGRQQSAKAEVIVREIRKILKKDPTDKILIFSAWVSMLDVLQSALTENDISCAQVKSGKKFQEAIQLFKDPLKKVTALLLPVSRGSKGLNLTEARHVFLVEPILNPASELQALGRVHRIGQNKETIVHRFVVKGTIEERMHIVLKAHQGHTQVEEDPVTLRDLYNMFASQQDTPDSQEEENDDLHDMVVI
ncbi:E3 ubiquitin-protein ligase SHPRH [Neocloeon triangulifer]|uniref:E3 ubiquitin-protein ligase SHPRH n=1 Tax=Neocloeon triangulifer TaxID=2078957 RepID=UPI00286F68FE|nr:E3 ubiquitin-protein ligase SHPRH [Neocloeon triangulifer]